MKVECFGDLVLQAEVFRAYIGITKGILAVGGGMVTSGVCRSVKIG